MKQRKKVRRLLFMVLTAVISASFLTGCNKNTRTTKEMEVTTFGIDVARYQGTIDWQRTAQSGVDFAMVRIGYRGMSDGIIKADSNGKFNLQEASKAGIPVGVYFFSTAITAEEAMEEAAWVVDQIAGYPITYPVAYDCEAFNEPESRQYGMTKKERTEIALSFLETIESLGYEGMFYASKNDMEADAQWDMSRIEEKYKVWVAQYPAEPYPATEQTSYSGSHQMWQYSREGVIPGINQPVDLNIAYFGYDGIEPPRSKEIPEEVEADVEALMNFKEVNEQVTAKEETNLRDIPSQDSDSTVLRTLQNGEVAQRIAVSTNGWSKLIFEGQIYYAVSSYLTTDLVYGYETDIVVQAEVAEGDIQTQFSEVNQKVTAKDVVNLRSLPSVEHEEVEVIAQLKNGDIATCVGISDNGWSKLIYRGTTCYAISSYLTQAKDSAVESVDEEVSVGISFSEVNEYVTANNKVNLRTIPNTERQDSEIITQLQEGDMVLRVGISSNGWSKLIYNGTVCYAVSRYLEVKDDFTVDPGEIQTKFKEVNDHVTAKDEVNLRSLPSVEDPDCIVVAKLTNGEVITRTGINEALGWSRVEYNGQTLYCVSSYLTAPQ